MLAPSEPNGLWPGTAQMPLKAKEIVKGIPASSASLRTFEPECGQEAEDTSAKMTLSTVRVATPSKGHVLQPISLSIYLSK